MIRNSELTTIARLFLNAHAFFVTLFHYIWWCTTPVEPRRFYKSSLRVTQNTLTACTSAKDKPMLHLAHENFKYSNIYRNSVKRWGVFEGYFPCRLMPLVKSSVWYTFARPDDFVGIARVAIDAKVWCSFHIAIVRRDECPQFVMVCTPQIGDNNADLAMIRYTRNNYNLISKLVDTCRRHQLVVWAHHQLTISPLCS